MTAARSCPDTLLTALAPSRRLPGEPGRPAFRLGEPGRAGDRAGGAARAHRPGWPAEPCRELPYVDAVRERQRRSLPGCVTARFEQVAPVGRLGGLVVSVTSRGRCRAATAGWHAGVASRPERDRLPLTGRRPEGDGDRLAPPVRRHRHDGERERPLAPDHVARRVDGSAARVDAGADERIEPKGAEAFEATRTACVQSGWAASGSGYRRRRGWRMAGGCRALRAHDACVARPRTACRRPSRTMPWPSARGPDADGVVRYPPGFPRGFRQRTPYGRETLLRRAREAVEDGMPRQGVGGTPPRAHTAGSRPCRGGAGQ